MSIATVRDLFRISRIAYDFPSAGITTVTDARGNQTRYTFDQEHRLSEVTLPGGAAYTMTFSDTNQVASVTDPSGAVTSATYDDNGNRLTVTDALGQTEIRTYDANHNLLNVMDRNGNISTFTYSGIYATSATDPAGNHYLRLQRLRPTRRVLGRHWIGHAVHL